MLSIFTNFTTLNYPFKTMAKTYTADDIDSLSGITHVRMRPEMYFQTCFKEKTLDNILLETLCHAFDEYYDGNCSEIQFYINKDSFSINYNAGMSLSSSYGLTKAEAIMTSIAACSNMKKHLAIGEEFCSIGMATINAISEVCKLKTVSNKKKGIFVFEKGKTEAKVIKEDTTSKDYTEIYFKIDKEILKDLLFTSKGIKEKVNYINSRFKDLDIKLIDKIS